MPRGPKGEKHLADTVMVAISCCAFPKDREPPLSLLKYFLWESLHHLVTVMIAVSDCLLGATKRCAFPNDTGASACPCRGSALAAD